MRRRTYPLLSEIDLEKLNHAAWRMDKYTGFGLITISRLLRGQFGDMPINQAFEKVDMSPHQAKIHAWAVLSYSPNNLNPLSRKK